MTNPYEPPLVETVGNPQAPSRLLFWFSLAIVVICAIIWLAVVGSFVTDLVNGWVGNLKIELLVTTVFTIILGTIGIPQSLSVFRRSRSWAYVVSWLSIFGMIVGLLAAIIYPIVEYNYNFSPPGFEILGAVSYSGIAALFFLNFWLHRTWADTLTQKNAG